MKLETIYRVEGNDVFAACSNELPKLLRDIADSLDKEAELPYDKRRFEHVSEVHIRHYDYYQYQATFVVD